MLVLPLFAISDNSALVSRLTLTARVTLVSSIGFLPAFGLLPPFICQILLVVLRGLFHTHNQHPKQE